MRRKTDAQGGDDTLERVTELQRLGQALFQREAGRLARRHGVDDPRAQRMIRSASGAQEMLQALETARDAAPQQVSAAPEEAVVYGRVASDDLKAVAGVEVLLEDTGGRVVRSAGSATTDASGRFLLRIPAAVTARLAGKEYLITARGAKDEVLYRAPAAVKIERSQAVEVEVNLGAREPIRRAPAPPRRTRPPEPNTEPHEPEPGKPDEQAQYGVAGRVLRASGKPVAGVLVRIYDQDRQYDDLLGAALTNRKGLFSVRYRRQDFSEGETAADLYFVVVDANEHELLSTADQVRFNAARETTVTLTISEDAGAQTSA